MYAHIYMNVMYLPFTCPLLCPCRGETSWRGLRVWRIRGVCRFLTYLLTASPVCLGSRTSTYWAPSTWRKTWYWCERTFWNTAAYTKSHTKIWIQNFKSHISEHKCIEIDYDWRRHRRNQLLVLGFQISKSIHISTYCHNVQVGRYSIVW